jgi:hypothetical protein
MKTSRRGIVVAAMLGASLLVAGCAEMKEQAAEIREILRTLRGKQPAPPPPAPPPAAQIPAPAAGGLSMIGNCVGKEETGYAENVRLDVAGGKVSRLEARIDIPGKGSCTYRLADFQQTKQTPYVELLARSKSACALRMWQQGDRITLAATDCAEKCTRDAFDYAWPVEFNTAGRCY